MWEYYRLKTLKSMGIFTPLDHYSPYDLDVLCRIEQEYKILENKEIEAETSKINSAKRR